MTYEFLDEWNPGLMVASCLTLARDITPEDLLRRMGGEPQESRHQSIGAASRAAIGEVEYGVTPVAFVVEVDGGSLAVEYNGWHGSLPEVMAAVSKGIGTAAASVFHNINAVSCFTYSENEKVLCRCTLYDPDTRSGAEPDRLHDIMALIGFRTATDDEEPWRVVKAVALGLEVASMATGVRFTRQHLDERLFWWSILKKLS